MTREQELHLSRIVQEDPIYQRLLMQCKYLEADYLRIRDSLPENDHLLLERYITLCEELDHRRLSLALTIYK